MIEPKYHAISVAGNSTGSSREAALLAKFSSNVAETISFGRRLCLFRNEIVLLSSFVGREVCYA